MLRHCLGNLCGGFAALALSVATPAVAIEPAVVTDTSNDDASLSIHDVRTSGSRVTGVIVNNSENAVRNVELVIRRSFLWNDEFHPGADNPGRSALIRVPEEIPPGGSALFEYEGNLPSASRADGTFRTSVDVIRFTELIDAER